MSVWKFPCYRDDVLETALRSFAYSSFIESPLVRLMDFVVEDFGDFGVKGNLKKGNMLKQFEKGEIKLKELYVIHDKPPISNDAFFNTIKNVNEVRFGLKEVYNLAYQHIVEIRRRKEEMLSDLAFIGNIYVLGMGASYMGTGRAAKYFTDNAKADFQKLGFIDIFKRYVLHIKNMLSAKQLRKRIQSDRILGGNLDPYEIPKHIGNQFREYDHYIVGNLLFLTDDNFRTMSVLGRKDLDRIYQVVRGYTMHELASTRYSDKIDVDNSAYVRKVFLNSLRCRADPNVLCRAWDVFYNMIIAEIASDVSKEAYNLHKVKIQEEGLDKYFDMNNLEATIKNSYMREKIDYLSLYKCLPTPDFDYFGAAFRQRELYSVRNPFLEGDVGMESIKELKTYYKYMMMIAYRKRHGKVPGRIKDGIVEKDWHYNFPYINLKKMPYTVAADIDLENAFDYHEFGKDIMSLVKDSAINPARYCDNGYDMNKVDLRDKNMLVDVFSRDNDIDVNEIFFDNVPIDVKAEDKPEAKKPNGRWFFELGTDARLKLSEYESALSEYIPYMPGCAVGLSRAKMIRKMNSVTEGAFEVEGVSNKKLFISFDLEKFSPHYAGQIHRIFDKLNAKMFGVKEIERAFLTHQKGKIVYLKKSVRHEFAKPDGDLEGFSGKFNTILHACVMGLAMNRVKNANLIKGPGRLATFIDDGLLRLVLDKDNYAENVHAIVKSINNTYKAYGLKISFDKTLISSNFNVFLHKFYYNGRELTSSCKAFMKMDNYADATIDNILDDVAYIESTARAALEVGTNHNLVYITYSYMVFDCLRRWNKNKVALKAADAVRMFAPVRLSGLGIKTCMQMEGVVEYVSDCGWLSILTQFRRRAPKVVEAILRICDQPMKTVDDLHYLNSVVAPQTTNRCLRTNRLSRKIELAILDKFVRQGRGNLSFTASGQYGKIVSGIVRTDAPCSARKRLHDSTLETAIETVLQKFIRSRTAQDIIGKRAYRNILFANQNDVKVWFEVLKL